MVFYSGIFNRNIYWDISIGLYFKLDEFIRIVGVVGILVDDAIVVLENIYRHMEMGKTASVQPTMELPKLVER
jgi:hypothetical protein